MVEIRGRSHDLPFVAFGPDTRAGLLEEAVENRLQAISRGGPFFSTRILRAGAWKKRPVEIHAAMSPDGRSVSDTRGNEVLLSADRLAHELSRCRTAPPAHLRKIIIMPESAAGAGHLLTHLFLPRTGILGIYLHPLRLNERREEAAPGRLIPFVKIPGLLESVLGAIAMISPDDRSSRCHEFFIPLDQVTDWEMGRMRIVEDAYGVDGPR